jgi:pyruvate dehydrogenase E1 component
VVEQLGEGGGPVVAASDYMTAVPEQIARWLPDRMEVLGTDGFGRSDTRAALRRFFEVDAEHIAATALAALARRGDLKPERAAGAIRELGLDPEAPDPVCQDGGRLKEPPAPAQGS